MTQWFDMATRPNYPDKWAAAGERIHCFRTTPMHLRHIKGHQVVGRIILLVNGVRVYSQFQCTTPMHLRHLKGHQVVGRIILLVNGVRVYSQFQCTTPMHLRHLKGHQVVGRIILLVNGVRVYSQFQWREEKLLSLISTSFFTKAISR